MIFEIKQYDYNAAEVYNREMKRYLFILLVTRNYQAYSIANPILEIL